jgi:hypothetical protein
VKTPRTRRDDDDENHGAMMTTTATHDAKPRTDLQNRPTKPCKPDT